MVENFFSNIRNKTTLIQHNTGSTSKRNQIRKRNKSYQNQKGRSKIIFVCKWHYFCLKMPTCIDIYLSIVFEVHWFSENWGGLVMWQYLYVVLRHVILCVNFLLFILFLLWFPFFILCYCVIANACCVFTVSHVLC